MAFLSLEGLYNYDSTLFDGFNVPKQLDKNVAITTICTRSREFELLYPDMNFMKNRIQWWSQKNKKNWQKLADTLDLEYNPIENYDRKEEWSENVTHDNSIDENHTRQSTSNNKKTDNTNRIENGSSTHQNTAFNDGLKDSEKDYGSTTVRNTGTQTFTDTTNDTDTNSTTDAGTQSHKHEGRMHGNIGVTTTQQMIDEERRVAMYNLYDVIANSFVEEFCLMIY